MGDRANIHVKGDFAEDNGVYLYSHWDGSNLPTKLQKALKKEWRWHDGQYLTRIIFDVMSEGFRDRETGLGISSYCGDGENRVLIVDVSKQTVTRKEKSYSFQEYINLTSEQIKEIW